MFRATEGKKKTLDLEPLTPVVFVVSKPRTEVVLFHFQHLSIYETSFSQRRLQTSKRRVPIYIYIYIVFRFYVSEHHKPHFRLIGWPVPSSFTRFPFFIVPCACETCHFAMGFFRFHYRLILFYIWQPIWRLGGLYQLYAPCTFTMWRSLWIQCVLKYSLKSHLSVFMFCILNGGRYEYRFRQCSLIKPFLVASPSSLIHSQSLRWCDRRVQPPFGRSFLPAAIGTHVSGLRATEYANNLIFHMRF